jgi:hypothetical protein
LPPCSPSGADSLVKAGKLDHASVGAISISLNLNCVFGASLMSAASYTKTRPPPYTER